MKKKKSQPSGAHHAPHAPRAAAVESAPAFRLTVFPKEFERHIWEEIDKRFYIILFSCWIFIYSICIFLGIKQYSEADLQESIRKRYLKEFYEAEIIEPIVSEEEEEGLGVGEEEEKKTDERADRDRGKTDETRGQSVAERAAARRAAAAARSAARGRMEAQVAGSGILGVLSAGGIGGSGDAVADVLGSAGGGVGDLDALLSSVGGLATASAAGQRSRLGSRGGGRSTGSADVTDLIQGVGSVGSASIGRKGSIRLAIGDASVSGRGSKAANRGSDEILRVINSHTDAINYCYKREAKLDPNLKGTVTVQFVINFNGRVGNVRILSNSTNNKQLESCIINKIRLWRFKEIDQREGDVTTRTKFIFG
jgi:TonB family protein